MTTEKIRTKTSSKLLEDLAALAYETDHRKPEVVGAPTEKHSAISEAQGAFAKYASARAKELDPEGETITEKDIIGVTSPSDYPVDSLTLETMLGKEVEARLEEHQRTGEPIDRHSPTAKVQAAFEHIKKLREAETSGRSNFIGDERGD